MKVLRFHSLLILLFLFSSLQIIAQEKTNPNNQSEELGKVSWYRNYEEALQLSSKENKPVLILFQEVPGCSTCRNYGHNVLTHPLMVEAIENSFIPLAIYNNKGGKDRAVLQKYGEPSWNNPVVRIVGSNGKDLVNRVGGDYSAATLISRMHLALKENQPNYIKLLASEFEAEKENAIQTSYFKMYCFWSGEKHFGALNGVLETEAGFMSGNEVVKVKYDTRKLSQKKLEAYAQSASCSPIQKSNSYRVATNDLKYYLQKTNYKYLPLTALQQVKINSALGNGQSGKKYLSPKQLVWFNQLRQLDGKKEVLFSKPFMVGWQMLEKKG